MRVPLPSRARVVLLLGAVLGLSIAAAGLRADDAAPPAAPVPPSPPAPSPPTPTIVTSTQVVPAVFPSVEDAAKAYFDAMERNDDARLVVLFGTSGADLVQDGRDADVLRRRKAYAEAAKSKLGFDRSGEARGIVTMVIGPSDHPVSIPIAKTATGWFLDANAGRVRVLERRIGRNELAAIAICRTYVEAQVAYASLDRDGDGVREYARRLVSTPGAHDGLYWADGGTEDPSPLGIALTPLKDLVEGRVDVAPFGGYTWRILRAQGIHAPGGAMPYVVDGHMTAGFALLASPYRYRVTGVKSFLVSHRGSVFEKDVGESGRDVAEDMEGFDPDPTWTAVDDPGDDDPDGTDAVPLASGDGHGRPPCAPVGEPAGGAAPPRCR